MISGYVVSYQNFLKMYLRLATYEHSIRSLIVNTKEESPCAYEMVASCILAV